MIQVKKVISEKNEQDFIETLLLHARKNNMTIHNVREATAKAIHYMESNATLRDKDSCAYKKGKEITNNRTNILTKKLANGTGLEIRIAIKNFNEKDKDELENTIIKKAIRMKKRAKEAAWII